MAVAGAFLSGSKFKEKISRTRMAAVGVELF